ncbi:MAG: hypothetical protein R2849_00555 [Thermomicrobiales bacterium]
MTAATTPTEMKRSGAPWHEAALDIALDLGQIASQGASIGVGKNGNSSARQLDGRIKVLRHRTGLGIDQLGGEIERIAKLVDRQPAEEMDRHDRSLVIVETRKRLPQPLLAGLRSMSSRGSVFAPGVQERVPRGRDLLAPLPDQFPKRRCSKSSSSLPRLSASERRPASA